MRLAPDGGAGGLGVGPKIARRRRRNGAPTEVDRERRAWLAHCPSVSAAFAGDDGALTAWLLSDVAWAVRSLGSDHSDGDSSDPDAALRTVRRALDVVHRLLEGRAYLSGGGFSTLDLSAAAVLAPIARPEGWCWARVTAPRRSDSLWPTEFYNHPTAAWVRRVYDAHAGPGAVSPAALAWAP